jgi:hypothetical protein
MDEIDGLADTRHDYVHGSVAGRVIRRSKLTVTLGSLLQPPKKPHRPPVKVTTVQIENLANRLHEIGDELLDLAEAVLHERKTVPIRFQSRFVAILNAP